MKILASVLATALVVGATGLAAAANARLTHRHSAPNYMALAPRTELRGTPLPAPAVDPNDARGSMTGGPSGGIGEN